MGNTQSKEAQEKLTPAAALELLKEGNSRFVANEQLHRDFRREIRHTADGQYPFAIVLGCIDSRGPIETVFDQGIGDVFAARVAGNVVSPDLLGSMEFACSIAGSRAVVVMGHTDCGAVKGAIGGASGGNLTGLLEKLEHAVHAVAGERDASNPAYVNEVAEANVRVVLGQIRDQSPVLAEMEAEGSIMIVGSMYDVSTGEVRFL